MLEDFQRCITEFYNFEVKFYFVLELSDMKIDGKSYRQVFRSKNIEIILLREANKNLKKLIMQPGFSNSNAICSISLKIPDSL
jgi:hypothetical protein